APRTATAARRSPATRREPASRRDPRENAPLIHKRGGRDRSGPLPVPAARRLRLALRLAALERDELAGVAIAGAHQAPVLPRVGVENRERAEAAPLLAGLDDGDGHAVEAAPLHARVEVARVADRPPHDVDEALGEAREGAEAAPVRELARDRRQQVDLGRAEVDRAVERDVPGEAPVDVPVAAELDGREEERDGVAGARDGAQLAPVGAVALAVHLAPPAREVEQHELELERARVELLEVDVLLDPAGQAFHREERHAEEGVVAEARRE